MDIIQYPSAINSAMVDMLSYENLDGAISQPYGSLVTYSKCQRSVLARDIVHLLENSVTLCVLFRVGKTAMLL